jgi:hypothetical protein
MPAGFGWKAVKFEGGLSEFRFRCPKCKARHRIRLEHPAFYGTRDSGGVLRDAAPCPAGCGAVLSRIFHNPAQGVFYVALDPLVHRVREDGGHRCDARCESARGNSCECKCGGLNHGRSAF